MIHPNDPVLPEIKTDLERCHINQELFPNTYSEGGLTILEEISTRILSSMVAGTFKFASEDVMRTMSKEALMLAKIHIEELNKEGQQ